jgi:biotin synthase
MSIEEIVDTAVHAVKTLGFKALVLQSGEDFFYGDNDLVKIVQDIKKQCGVLLFMSIGERSVGCYRRLHAAGAYGALLRFETSNPKIYASLHSKRKLESRLLFIRKLKKIGYILATGFIIGLPGQTDKDLTNDLLLEKSLRPDMLSFGPLIPHPDTPLASVDNVPVEKVLKVIALSRLMMPDSHIVVTTALETLDHEGRRKGLLAGANSVMINLTPTNYRDKYEIYPNKAGNDVPVRESINRTLKLLHSLGRAPTDFGGNKHVSSR